MRLFFLIVFSLSSLFIFAEEGDGEIVVLPKNKVIQGNYFASGKNIEISGRVEGDAYVFGSQAYIDGVIDGDLLIVAGAVHISGHVKKSIRLIAGQVLISGEIDGNLTILSGNAELAPSATIHGNLVGVSGNFDLGSLIQKSVRIYSSNLRLSGDVGNVRAYVGHIRVSSRAEIHGNFEYWSNTDALIDPHSVISGKVTQHPSFFYEILHGKLLRWVRIGSSAAALLMNFLYTYIVGLILLRFYSSKVQRARRALERPMICLLYGIGVVTILPLLSLLFLISILGAPFALTLIALNVVGFYTVKIFTIMWVGYVLFKKVGYMKFQKLYFLLTLIMYFLLTLIPVVGWMIAALFALLGFGSVVYGRVLPEN